MLYKFLAWKSSDMFGFSRSSSSSYHKENNDEDCDSLLNESESGSDTCEEGHQRREPRTPRSRALWTWTKGAIAVAILALYSLLFFALGAWGTRQKQCDDQTMLWSPLNEAVEYIEYDFNTAFDQKSEYRGPPSPDLEKAWDKLLRLNPVPFPEDKLPLVNRSGGVLDGHKLARIGEEPDSPVAAIFEVFHQLHCLNYLRQYTWRDWYFRHPDKVVIPKDMLASDVGVRMHADHCIDLIREALICHGDTAPFFTVVDPEQPQGARGDFNAHHKCKDFSKLQAWVDENHVDINAILDHNG